MGTHRSSPAELSQCAQAYRASRLMGRAFLSFDHPGKELVVSSPCAWEFIPDLPCSPKLDTDLELGNRFLPKGHPYTVSWRSLACRLHAAESVRSGVYRTIGC